MLLARESLGKTYVVKDENYTAKNYVSRVSWGLGISRIPEGWQTCRKHQNLCHKTSPEITGIMGLYGKHCKWKHRAYLSSDKGRSSLCTTQRSALSFGANIAECWGQELCGDTAEFWEASKLYVIWTLNSGHLLSSASQPPSNHEKSLSSSHPWPEQFQWPW